MANDGPWDLGFTTATTVDKKDLEYFQALRSSCTRSYFDDPAMAYLPIPFSPRYPKDGSVDTFFSRTINSPDTIPHLLSLIRKDVLHPNANDTLESVLSAGDRDQPHLVVLADIDSGLNGFRDTVHGGVLASLIDETMGCCVETFRKVHSVDRMDLFTADLQLSYRAPAPTPGVIVIKTYMTRRENRKWFIEAVVTDVDGKVLVQAKALWIQAKEKASL